MLKSVLEKAGVRLIQPQFWEKDLHQLVFVLQRSVTRFRIIRRLEISVSKCTRRTNRSQDSSQIEDRIRTPQDKIQCTTNQTFSLGSKTSDSILWTSKPEIWARIATRLAQTRHHVRGSPNFLNNISEEVPAVMRPIQLDKEMTETCTAWIFDNAFEWSWGSPLSSKSASTQCPTF